MKKFLICLLMFMALLFSCTETISEVRINNGESLTIEVGEMVTLSVSMNFETTVTPLWSASKEIVSIDDNGNLTALEEGFCVVTVSVGSYQDTISIKVIPGKVIDLELTVENSTLFVEESTNLNCTSTSELFDESLVEYIIVSGEDVIRLEENKVFAVSVGEAIVIAKHGVFESNQVVIEILEKISIDPYINVTSAEFYANYTPATSSIDAYYRSLHGFMSGDISPQDQEPTKAFYQPMENGKYIRNTDAIYSKDMNTYYIVDGYGNVVNKIYRGGGYVTLEEVAAYVLAFGDIPANYVSKKSGSPSSSIWGKYLRLNHSQFSGSTSQYPYEPELPNISGCGGDLYYYEIDLGTTGTDCDPGYAVVEYNNGNKITRGAARIVYTRYDRNKNEIIDINEKYVFYTYNHYNDFQEYLNYEGGWGEKFGNITGGGSLSSKYDYNPTAYVTVERKSFEELYKQEVVAMMIDEKKKCLYLV